MLPIIITGAKGRMGQMLIACAARNSNLQVVGLIDQGDELRKGMEQAKVVIDFSSHNATPIFAEICAEQGKAMVIGTTGHSEAERNQIRHSSTKIPIVLSSNFSTGVNALFWLTRKAAQILGPDYDLEILELHHRLKRDAPSGTAKRLAEILAETRQLDLEEASRHGRSGVTGERTPTEIGIHSLRGGDVVGDHTVIFAGPGERVELTHKASNRETFANGALRAAEWVAGQKAGMYDMQDVLGLK
ncbi:MAG: 4-hydroxy-tetrahydrodipicolinate reductase [Verrucomicrobia bacterium]|nr:MAG: 4-hydroxy-tetrahydrodipicolinate reductase [Verrucomicrobiota bacterium]